MLTFQKLGSQLPMRQKLGAKQARHKYFIGNAQRVDGGDNRGDNQNVNSAGISDLDYHTLRAISQRNNTSFPLAITNYIKNIKQPRKYEFLKYYQNVVRDYMQRLDEARITKDKLTGAALSKVKGILIDHDMGLGKTMLAVAIAIDNIATRQCIIVSTMALHGNMRSTIKQYISLRQKYEPTYYLASLPPLELEKWIDRNFYFVSLNASNTRTQMERAAAKTSADGPRQTKRGTPIGADANVDTNANVHIESDDGVQLLEDVFSGLTRLPSLNGKLVIIDEAHGFFRGISNGSRNCTSIAELIKKSDDVRLLFLTGTPISNDPCETVPCFNLLAGEDVLPDSYDDFNKLYVDSANGQIKNKEYFQNRILGLVSSVNRNTVLGKGFGAEYASQLTNTTAEFPAMLPVKLEKVPMAPEQWSQYKSAREYEKEEGGGGGGGALNNRYAALKAPATTMVKPKSGKVTSYRVRSRQLGNCAVIGATRYNVKALEDVDAADIISPKFDRLLEIVHPGWLHLVYSQFTGIGGTGSLRKRLLQENWQEVTANDSKVAGSIVGADEHSSDYAAYIDSLTQLEFNEAAFIGSAEDDLAVDIGDEDDDLLADIAPVDDVEPHETITGPRPEGPMKFAVISGEVKPADRVRIMEIYNSPENAHGGLIDMLIISSTGAEGIHMQRIRIIVLLEPFWTYARMLQIMNRGPRSNSHVDLAADEKNVQPYVFLAVDPTGTEKTTDEELWEGALKEQNIINTFLAAIREVSIECLANGECGCYVCNPDNKKIYTADPAADLRAPNPCTPLQEKKVTARPVVFGGQTYYYSVDEGSVFKIAVYELSEGGHRRLRENDSRLGDIAEQLAAAGQL